MLLGAADALDLDEVEDLHRVRIAAYTPLDVVDHALGREPLAHAPRRRAGPARAPQRLVARNPSQRGRESARRRRPARASPVSPSSTTVDVPPAFGGHDRHAGGERLDRDDRRALVRRDEEERVERARTTRRRRGDSRGSGSAIGRRRATARALPPPRGPRRRRSARAWRRTRPSAIVRTRSSGRLIAVRRPIQPTTNVSAPAPISARARFASRPCSRRSRVEVEAVPHDDELRRGRDAVPDQIVPHLVADRDQARRSIRANAALDEAEDALAPWVEVPAQYVAVVFVDDRARTRASASGRSRDAPDRAGLGGMRVDDVGSLRAGSAGAARGSRARPPAATVALECGHAARTAHRARPRRLHRLLAVGNRPRDDDRVVSARALSRRELEHARARRRRGSGV